MGKIWIKSGYNLDKRTWTALICTTIFHWLIMKISINNFKEHYHFKKHDYLYIFTYLLLKIIMLCYAHFWYIRGIGTIKIFVNFILRLFFVFCSPMSAVFKYYPLTILINFWPLQMPTLFMDGPLHIHSKMN